MNKFSIHGETASLMWAYNTAATLSTWRITQDQQQWKLAATVDKVDRFRASQRPLLFEVRHDSKRSRWILEDLRISENQLTATLGQPVQ